MSGSHRPRLAAIGTVVFFLAAPGVVAGVVPWAITGFDRPDDDLGVAGVAGLVLGALGLALVVECFWRFVREGVGTPAPVAPTEFLVQGVPIGTCATRCTSASAR